MARYSIVDCGLWSKRFISTKIRKPDIEEIKAATGAKSRREVVDIIYGIVNYDKGNTFAAYANGRLLCIFGVKPSKSIECFGRPWVLATKLVEDHPIFFLRASKKITEIFLKEYKVLENRVWADNRTAIHWLQWLGFRVYAPKPYGVRKALFCTYRKEVES